MECCVGSGSGLGCVVTYQAPVWHKYTPGTPANTPVHYLHIPGHGHNENSTHNNSTHTIPEVYGGARMVDMGTVEYDATEGCKNRTWEYPNGQEMRLFACMENTVTYQQTKDRNKPAR